MSAPTLPAGLPEVAAGDQRHLDERLAVLDVIAEGLRKQGVDVVVAHSARGDRFRIVERAALTQ